MRCALVIPSWVPEDIFSSKTASSQINYWQPLGTLYVAAVLQRAGHEVKFFNGAFMTHEKILREVQEFKPAFIGIYSTTFGWQKAKKTAGDIRRGGFQTRHLHRGPAALILLQYRNTVLKMQVKHLMP